MKSLVRRISDGRMLGLIKAWLEMPVEEDDGKGGKRRTNRARKERKGTPQGGSVASLAKGRCVIRGLPVHLMILRWPDGPVAMPWVRVSYGIDSRGFVH